MFWDLRTGPTLAVLSLLLQKLFWSYSFCDIYRPQKNKVNAARLLTKIAADRKYIVLSLFAN